MPRPPGTPGRGSLRRPAAVDGGGDREDHGHDTEGDEDEGAAVDQHALAAHAVHQHDARQDADDLEGGDEQRLGQGHRLGEADGREEGVGVEEDAVDAGELLECSDRHADKHEAAPLGRQDLPDGELRAARDRQRLGDGCDSVCGVFLAGQLGQDLLGLLGAAHGDEVTGRLGDCRREDDEEEGRDDEAGEEDLPGH